MLKYLNFSEKTFNKSHNFVHVVSSSVTHFFLIIYLLNSNLPRKIHFNRICKEEFSFCMLLFTYVLSHTPGAGYFPINFHFTENILYFFLALISIPVNHLSLSVACLQEISLASISLVVLILDELFYFQWFQIP